MEQNKGSTALIMGVIMMILGAAALVISFAHPRPAKEPAHSTTTAEAVVSNAQPLDKRADELASKLEACQKQLSAAEARLTVEQAANEEIRKELNEMRLAKQDIEAQLQNAAAERELAQKKLLEVQAELDKANTDAQAVVDKTVAAAREEAGKAINKAQAEISSTIAIKNAELELAKAAAKELEDKAERLDKLNQAQAQIIAALTDENTSLKQQLQQPKEAPAVAPTETAK